jgi:signal transduction histidine kinase
VSAREAVDDRRAEGARGGGEDRLDRIRAEVVSLITHDLRAPLCVVMGYLDLLRAPLTPSERERALEAARANAARIGELLDDMESASHADRLLASVSVSPVRLADLANEVVTSLERLSAGPRLDCEPLSWPIVRGDEMRLRQLLVNLVMNALKYSPPASPVRVRVTQSAATAVVEVVDHGPGVPEGDRRRIFERFARLGEGDDRPAGVGLGLYIVRIISENHGGTVRVDETPGGGATFVFEMPRLDSGDGLDG